MSCDKKICSQTSPCLEPCSCLYIYLFTAGFGAAWHLAYIEVEDLTTRKNFTFHCNKWLSKSDEDKQILRELTCGTSAKGSSPDMRGDKTSKFFLTLLRNNGFFLLV